MQPVEITSNMHLTTHPDHTFALIQGAVLSAIMVKIGKNPIILDKVSFKYELTDTDILDVHIETVFSVTFPSDSTEKDYQKWSQELGKFIEYAIKDMLKTDETVEKELENLLKDIIPGTVH